MQQLSPYLSRQEISHMNPEEIEFARQQLHRLLSEQMSKVSLELSKKEKIESNLEELRMKQEQQISEKIQRLNKKFENTDEKRKKALQKKIIQCKAHDKKLQQKLTEVNRRRIREEREAARKSRAYSMDLLKYLKEKELQKSHIQQKVTKEYMNRSKIYEEHNQQQFQYGRMPISRQKSSSIIQQSIRLVPSRTLDESIQLHQRRAKMREQQLIQSTFQKILKKMDMVNQRKLRVLKVKQKKESISRMSRRQRLSQTYDSQQKQQKQRRSAHRASGSPESKKTTIDYLNIKRQKQQQQFQQRGQLYARMRQKRRRDDIMKHLKAKVREHGISLLHQAKQTKQH